MPRLTPWENSSRTPEKKDFCWQRWGDFFCCCPASTTWEGFILLGHQLWKVIHQINSQHPKRLDLSDVFFFILRMASFQGVCLFDFECNMWLKEGEAALWRNTAFLKKGTRSKADFDETFDNITSRNLRANFRFGLGILASSYEKKLYFEGYPLNPPVKRCFFWESVSSQLAISVDPGVSSRSSEE